MRKPVERVVMTCGHCHKMFSVPHWEPKQGKGKFCSTVCKNRGRRQVAPSTPVDLTCQQCGASFTKPAWVLNRAGRGKYCSGPCANQGRKAATPVVKPNSSQKPAPVSPRADDLPLVDGSGYVPCARCRVPRLRGSFCSTCEWRAAEVLSA